MSKYLKKTAPHVFDKSRIVGIPEEIGVDIAQALDVLAIDTNKFKKPRKQHDKKDIEKLAKFPLLKCQNQVPFFKAKCQHKEPVAKRSLKSITKEFVEELQNELDNVPQASSKTLSSWFRSSTPSRSQNILFKETVSLGHFQGNAKKCKLVLTPQILTLSTAPGNTNLHVILDEIQLLQLDEFQTLIRIFASSNNVLTLENFPPRRMQKFLLVLNYLLHLAHPAKSQKFIHQFSWNFVLGRQKMAAIQAVYPVTLSCENQARMQDYNATQMIQCKIQYLLDEDMMEATETCHTSSWQFYLWKIKLNSLYAYDQTDGKEMKGFWLLTSIKELSQLDSDQDDFLLEMAFETDLILFRFKSQSDLDSWRNMLEKARLFNASNYYSGETVTQILELFVSLDSQFLLLFKLNEQQKISKEFNVSLDNIHDILLENLKPECTLVIIYLHPKCSSKF